MKHETLQERIRSEAVETVDRRHGYTCEFSASPRAHVDEYAEEEHHITQEYADDPGRVICEHENRTHGLGGGIFVCFACWAKLLLGGRR